MRPNEVVEARTRPLSPRRGPLGPNVAVEAERDHGARDKAIEAKWGRGQTRPWRLGIKLDCWGFDLAAIRCGHSYPVT